MNTVKMKESKDDFVNHQTHWSKQIMISNVKRLMELEVL